MSHFTVLVVGPDVEGQLAPYHEFECTGVDDKYVLSLDMTAETLADFEENKDGRSMLEFAKDWHGYPVLTDGETTTEDHKYGYIRVTPSGDLVSVIRRTNPNKKWDWWKIGGRWNGYFKLKANRAKTAQSVVGAPGLNSMDDDYEPPDVDRADQCRKGDIDIEGMRDEAGAEAKQRWELLHSVIDAHPPIVPWKEVLAKFPNDQIEAARKEYWAQPGIQAIRSVRELAFTEPSKFAPTVEEHIQHARDTALMTFAVVKDSKWHERGDMGWWGIVTDEKDRGDWAREFSSLIDSLPDSELLTVVDCHI